jgi:Lipocalin-like domain
LHLKRLNDRKNPRFDEMPSASNRDPTCFIKSVGELETFDNLYWGHDWTPIHTKKDTTMNRRHILSLSVITAVGVALLPGSALAQQKSLKDQLVGAWTFVSSETKLPDGSLAWGSNPKGLVIFTDNGRYSSHIMRSDRPKFASNNRATGTPDENKAAVQGALSGFGTYSVNEANKTFTVRFEGNSYPNQEGTEQTRACTIAGDELRVMNPSPTVGGPPSQLIYKRAK